MSSPFATSEDIVRACQDYRDWLKEAIPSAPYQPRVMVGTAERFVARRPFKSGGYWCARGGGVARLLSPINVAPSDQPELLVFPAFYGRHDSDAAAIRAKAVSA